MGKDLGATSALHGAASVLGCTVDHRAFNTQLLLREEVRRFLSAASNLQFLDHAAEHHDVVLGSAMDEAAEESVQFAAGLLAMLAQHETDRAVVLQELQELQPVLVELGVLKVLP